MTASMPTLPPPSIEAEQAVLGAVLLDNAALVLARGLLTPGDFYQTANQVIFQTMLRMADSGEAIDNISLTVAMDGKKKLDSVGGATYLAELLTTVPSAVNIVTHARVVAEKAHLRRLKKRLNVAMEAVEQGAEREHLAGIIDTMNTEVKASAISSTTQIEAISFSEIKQEEVQWLLKGRIPTTMLTGLVGDPDLGKTLLTFVQPKSVRIDRKSTCTVTCFVSLSLQPL